MINYGGIPNSVLNLVLGEDYYSDYTLKMELDKIGEDILYVSYKIGTDKIEKFIAHTKNFVLCIIDTGFGDQCILSLPRNPPIK